MTWTWTAPEGLPESDTPTPRTEAQASAKFAKLALAYAKENGIDPVRSTENEDDFVSVEGGIRFENLELGYYLLDSTMGALCGLTTTNPNAAIRAKNSAPTIDKQVLEDSTNQYGDSNTADIGQTVSFRTTINVHAGAESYILHDKMSAGLTFESVTKIDSQGIKIDGDKFKIYDAATGGNEGAVVLMDDNVTYRRARADETGVEIEVKNGQVRVVGFDNGTYYLEETEAPDGYNKLTGRQAFTIADGNLTASFDQDGKISAGSGVQVVNKTGSMLPETGAMGTVLFISFGTFVALGTGTLLVTKKRMSMSED